MLRGAQRNGHGDFPSGQPILCHEPGGIDELAHHDLELVPRAQVTRVLFEGTRAVGVEYRAGKGPLKEARAAEVILCGGSINTPQLLELSGVGDAKALGELGIDVVHDLPGVGENLQDHLEVYVQYSCKQPVSVAPAMLYRNRPSVFLKWLLMRDGPGATNHFEGGGFARSNDDVIYPNLMFHFLPVAVRYDGSSPAGGHGYQVHIGPMYSDSRGSVHIKSSDPFAKPALRFNYLSTEQDKREWVEAIGVARKILTQPAFEPYNGGELSPGPASRRRRRSSTGSGRTPRPRCTRRAPARWAPARMQSSIRRACAYTASKACASWTPRSSRT